MTIKWQRAKCWTKELQSVCCFAAPSLGHMVLGLLTIFISEVGKNRTYLPKDAAAAAVEHEHWRWVTAQALPASLWRPDCKWTSSALHTRGSWRGHYQLWYYLSDKTPQFGHSSVLGLLLKGRSLAWAISLWLDLFLFFLVMASWLSRIAR